MQNDNFSLFLMVMLIAPLQFVDADDKFDAKKMVDLHNYYRQIHGSGKLKLNSKLSAIAMEVAINETNNAPTLIGDNGFNVYWIRHDDSSSTSELTAETVFHFWYKEWQYYVPGDSLDTEKTKHFTQIVWASTTEIGVAIAHGNEKVVVVAIYSPRGNIPSMYAANVFMP